MKTSFKTNKNVSEKVLSKFPGFTKFLEIDFDESIDHIAYIGINDANEFVVVLPLDSYKKDLPFIYEYLEDAIEGLKQYATVNGILHE